MSKMIDLTGQRFGMLEVLGYVRSDSNNGIWWKCRCDCGKIKFYCTRELKRRLSCGCMRTPKVRYKDGVKTEYGKDYISNKVEERESVKTLEPLQDITDTGVERLREAIVMEAIRDYGKVCNCEGSETKDELERFFRSEWFSALCDLDGEMIMRQIRGTD